MQANYEGNWWKPSHFSKKRDNLLLRAGIIRAIRQFFDDEGFLPVETPILQKCPVIDTHIRAFSTDLRGIDGSIAKTIYLHTSPEFAMKKLMVAGLDKIYQICPVFRNAEGSKRHKCEFTMIEWYRSEADYQDIMADCIDMIRFCAKAIDIKHLHYKEGKCDPFAPWERLTVVEAFKQHADINLESVLEDKEAFRQAVSALGIHTSQEDGWDDLFFRVMAEKIEPYLGMNTPTFLCDYPISMASLSKPKDEDPRFAERFELYVCGVELANAFSELTDAKEQVRRYHIEMDEKERLYGERYPLDDDFIAALEHGMPKSGGIALGIDRLIMLFCGAEDIQEVSWSE